MTFKFIKLVLVDLLKLSLSGVVNEEDDEDWEKVLDDDKSGTVDVNRDWAWVAHDERKLSSWEVFDSEVL